MRKVLANMEEDAPQVHQLLSVFLYHSHFHRFGEVFVKKRGKTAKATRRGVTLQHLYETMAYRALIQGRQERPSEAHPNKHFLDDQFKSAHAHFVEMQKSNVTIIGWDSARRLNGVICFKVGSDVESDLVANFREPFVHYGANVAADEKVFEFNSAKSGMLRVIPASTRKVCGTVVVLHSGVRVELFDRHNMRDRDNRHG